MSMELICRVVDKASLSLESCAIIACSCKGAYDHIGIVFMGYEQKINFILGQPHDMEDQSKMEKIKDVIKGLLQYQEGRYGYVFNTVCTATVISAIAKLSATCNAIRVIWRMLIAALVENDRLQMDWEPLKEKDNKFGKKMEAVDFSTRTSLQVAYK
jgi:hypothetical protein